MTRLDATFRDRFAAAGRWLQAHETDSVEGLDKFRTASSDRLGESLRFSPRLVSSRGILSGFPKRGVHAYRGVSLEARRQHDPHPDPVGPARIGRRDLRLTSPKTRPT